MTAPRNDYELAVWRRAHGEPALVLPPKPRKKRGNEESRIQQAVIRFWHHQHELFGLPEFALYSVPNGAWRSAITGAILKREGLRPGAPDLNLDVPRGKWHGLRIELKRQGGIVSDQQTPFILFLMRHNYCARVCYSYDEAVGLITRYLAGEENL